MNSKGIITQHRPAYFSGFGNGTNEFSSLEELFNIIFVDNFRKLPNGKTDPNFHQFSISNHNKQNLLMAEYKDGYEWWVVGYVNDNEIIKALPEWVAKHENDK